MHIDFLSGLSCEFRKLKGKELSALANAGDSISTQSFINMLRACWVTTISAGPYTHADEGVPNWDQVVSGDLLYGITMLSAGSIPDGDRYVFPVRCESRHVGSEASTRNFRWGVSLSADVKVQRMSADVQKSMRESGNRFSVKLLSGQDASFKLLTSSEDKPLRDLLRLHKIKNATLAERFAVQFTSVAGVNSDLRSRYRFFLDSDNDVLEDLREQTEKYDCGFNTAVEVTCPDPSCGLVQEVQLPFDRICSPRLKLPTQVAEEDPEEDPPQIDVESPEPDISSVS